MTRDSWSSRSAVVGGAVGGSPPRSPGEVIRATASLSCTCPQRCDQHLNLSQQHEGRSTSEPQLAGNALGPEATVTCSLFQGNVTRDLPKLALFSEESTNLITGHSVPHFATMSPERTVTLRAEQVPSPHQARQPTAQRHFPPS